VVYGDGTFSSIGIPGNGVPSAAYAINELGHAAGYAYETIQLSGNNTTIAQKAIFWSGSSSTTLSDLSTSQNGSFIGSSGQAINSSDQVAGWSDVVVTGTFTTHACIMQVGHNAIDLGTIPSAEGLLFPSAVSYAYGINNLGSVCGYSTTLTGNYHAFIYTAGSGGGMTDLGTLPGGRASFAFGINNSGTIVGYGDEGVSGQNFAWIYSSGSMQDLNTLTSGAGNWVMQAAYGINDYGQIVGTAFNNVTGVIHGFLLTPTNEATPPSVSTPPSNIQAQAGQNITIASNITGSSPLSFQWYNNGTAISGATSANLSLANVQATDSANYSVTATNLVGTVTTNATLTVTSPSVYPAGYTEWATGLNLTGASLLPTALPFGDTLPNFARFAMNIGAVATVGQLPVSSVQVVNGTAYLQLNYNVSKNLRGLRLIVQYSYDLQNWSALSNANIVQLADLNLQTAQYQASIAIPSSGSVYLRLVAQAQ
jgi:probable HAF family extracellular repeat protein